MLIWSKCPYCDNASESSFNPGQKEIACRNCKKNQIENQTDIFSKDATLNQCPCCGSAHLYRLKDFNRRIGVILIIVGVILAYFTYGISLIIVTLIDWSLTKIVGDVGICYKCQAQFRGSPAIKKLEPFNLVLFDYYKNLKPIERV